MDAMEISASALVAERTRMNMISSNLANINSTRTAEGGPYKRKDAVFTATPFAAMLDKSSKEAARAVEVSKIIEDTSPPRLQYEPNHPDANAQGYVAYPNVNAVEEMADMISATRAYEANITASKATMSMQMKALELGR